MATEESLFLESEGGYLPLGKAAVLLGVHSMTLRRWSDSGRFPCIRTPGGHRRFAVSDIRNYVARQKGSPVSGLPATWVDNALTQTRRQVAHHAGHRWLRAIEQEELRDKYRQLGHRLMGLLLQYIAAEVPNGTFLEEARKIGSCYGDYGTQAGLTLTSILEATIFFRDILLESSLQTPSNAYAESNASFRILRRVNQIINAVQLSVSEYYEGIDAGSCE